MIYNKKNFFNKFSLYIFDLDGVIFRGEKLIEYTNDVIKRLKSDKKKLVFLTNNSSSTPKSISRKLNNYNLSIRSSDVITSSIVCSNFLKKFPNISKKKVFVIGETGLIYALKNTKINILNKDYQFDEIIKNKNIKSDFVITGIDKKISYKKLVAATLLINRGAKYYATNSDTTLPTENGNIPGAGAIQALINIATNKTPIKIFGKPSTDGINLISDKYKVNKNNIILIGDRIDTDIVCAHNAQISSALVLTGVTTKKDIKNLSIQPNLIITNLSEVL